jgi:5'-nucleotidase
MRPLIFLTNDDGFFAEGLEALSRNLKDLGLIYVIAPDRERSATSLSLTLRRPLRVKKIRKNVYAVDGTPADCVYVGLKKLLPQKPSLLISGINKGPNLGQQDISYSGTVAAAIQGTFLEIPSMAISLLPDENQKYFYDLPARIVHSLTMKLLENTLPEKTTLNINFPPPPIKGIKLTKLGQKRYNPEIIEKKDPRQDSYYRIGRGNPKAEGAKNSDVMVIKEGFVTVTPLHTDLTDFQTMKHSIFKNILSSIAYEFNKKTL